MKEVIYYRCEYCSKDFSDKSSCQRHEKADAKKHKNIDTLLSLKRRDLSDNSLYYKFLEGDMSDTAFYISPADVLTRDTLSSLSQKSLSVYAKKIDEYNLVNIDKLCKLQYIAINIDIITFCFMGEYHSLEKYEDAFNVGEVSRVGTFSHRGEFTTIEFYGTKDSELYARIKHKLAKLIAETKLVHDDKGFYNINYATKTASSYDNNTLRFGSATLKTRKFESL